MRESKRLKRMAHRARAHHASLNLIPMLDVLSVLVFFLLFHSFNGDLPEQRLLLPQSIVETRPRGTVAVSVTPEAVLIQGEPVYKTSDLFDDRIATVPQITQRLEQIEASDPGTASEQETREVTLLADKTIPFQVLKKVMTSCTASGYGKISLAVIQKAAHG